MDAYNGFGLSNFDEGKTQTDSIIQVVFILLICVLGLLANLVVMFIILVLKDYKKSVTHWYVLQLALADSIFLLTLPFQASEELNNEWIYPVWMCKGKDSILFINYYASIMFLMVMSIDRYVAVCHSFSDKLLKLRKQSSAIIITICVWVIAIFLSIPVMIYSTTVGTEPNCKCTSVFPSVSNSTAECLDQGGSVEECSFDSSATCIEIPDYSGDYSGDYGGLYEFLSNNSNAVTLDSGSMANNTFVSSGDEKGSDIFRPDFSDAIADECHYFNQPPAWTAFLSFNFSVMFLVPFLVMTVCYGLILRRLAATKMKSTDATNKASKRADNERKRVTIMCATLVIVFCVCWVPFHAVHLARIDGIPSNTSKPCIVATIISTLLAYLNSALNPYLYSFLGTGCAKKFKNLKKAPTLKPMFTKTKKKKSKVRTGTDGHDDPGAKTTELMGRSSTNDHGNSSSQNPSTMITKAAVSKVSES